LQEGYSALSKAALMGHLAVVKYLVEKGCGDSPDSPNGNSNKGSNNDSPIAKARAFAQSKGHTDVVKFLLAVESNKR
jgi:ankyrin repeat protein